jgi:hypothetical protein
MDLRGPRACRIDARRHENHYRCTSETIDYIPQSIYAPDVHSGRPPRGGVPRAVSANKVRPQN